PRDVVVNVFPPQRPAVLSRHLDIAAGLVEEDDVVPVDAVHQLLERGARLFDVGPELLRRPEAFFFLVMPARRSARAMTERLTSTPTASSHTSQSSYCVASRCFSTRARSVGSCSSVMSPGFPPPCGSATTL